MRNVSEDEKKEKVEVKESKERAIEPWSKSDIFRTFDKMWEDIRQDFSRTWRPMKPWSIWDKPWKWGRPSKIMPREACSDLIDTGNEYQVCAEVPGISKEKLDVRITKNDIEISGKSEINRHEEEKGYVVKERGYSEIYRHMSFPEEVLPDKAEATLKEGLLKIKIPKKTHTPEVKKHKVEIK